jgi:hypothetical protein
MSELLECLASSIPAAAEAAHKLNGYVANIGNRLRETEIFCTSQTNISSVAHNDTLEVPHIASGRLL